MPEIAPWVEQYKNLVRREYAFYEKMAWNRPDLIRLLMDMRILRAETAKNMTRKYERAGGSDLCAELRTYLAWAEKDFLIDMIELSKHEIRWICSYGTM